jgi:cytolysin-activating lysine-acyltransferase
MSNAGKKKVGVNKMNDPGAAKRAEAPLLGEAALKDALAGFGVSPGAANGAGASEANGSGNTNAAAESPPKTVSQVLGEITWLMTQSPRHKSIPLGDLEWLLMPAILLKQFRIFYKGEQPVGVALWAITDEITAKRIDTGERRLTAAEWKCGTCFRILDVVAPFGGELEMRDQLNDLAVGSAKVPA